MTYLFRRTFSPNTCFDFVKQDGDRWHHRPLSDGDETLWYGTLLLVVINYRKLITIQVELHFSILYRSGARCALKNQGFPYTPFLYKWHIVSA